jgi:hypothetical protein
VNFNRYFLLVFLIALAACSKREPAKTPVARLDDQTLALEDIRAHTDTSHELSEAQIQQYVQRWLTEETLYREAVRRGLDRTPEMDRKIEDVRRELAVNALLDEEVYSKKTSEFPAEGIRQYYDAHVNEFNLLHDVAFVSFALFKNRDDATECRNLVLKGTPWGTVIHQRASTIIAHVDSSYRAQATLLPAELWRVASHATGHDPSFPINTSDGYYVLVVWKFFRQGQTAGLSLVEQEIRGRLTVERRKKMFEAFVQGLRAKHSIEVFLSPATDTATQKQKE